MNIGKEILLKQRILVVEDSTTQAEALRSLLDENGYEVSVSANGEAALERLNHEDFNLVLSDVMMGEMTGFDLAARIKRDPLRRHLPVVLLTSLTDPMDIVRGLECGADNYVTKPYEAEHLLRRVRHVLDNRRLRATTKASLGVSVRFMGMDLEITSDKEQILDLFIASVEEVVRTNELLKRRERELAHAHSQLEEYARSKTREASISSERYRALLQSAGDAILMADLTGRVMEVNTKATELLGLAPGDQVTIALVDPASDAEQEFTSLIERLRRDSRANLGERLLRRADDGEVWCEVSASLSEAEGEALVMFILRDVSERKRTEQELYSTNERLETLIDASPLAIVAVDREGHVQLWSHAAERTFGWRAEEAVGRLPPVIPPEGTTEFEGLLTRLLSGESLEGVEVRRIRRDGQALDVSVHANPIHDAGGEIVGGMAVIADITERKQAEAAVRATLESERANRAKSEFLSRMSHELRTPLNAILGFAQLLEYEVTAEDDIESVTQILHAGRHLLRLVDEVLDLSAIEAGRLALKLESVALDRLLDESSSLVGSLARQRGISITYSIDSEDPPVFADPQRLKQVLLNLLSNAIKYNREGGKVEVTCSRSTEGRVRLNVRDTGPGISSDLLPRLFEPFDRLGAEQRGIEGTGLGLVLSRSLVEAMGGELGVDSREGEGSTFWIDLDLAEDPARNRDVPGPVNLKQPREVTSEHTILLIEDNVWNVRLLERLFSRRTDLTLISAMQGSIGLELARERRPDLILLDLNLPDISGSDVLRRLQEDPELRRIPVVMVSGDAMPAQVDRLLEMGARTYLTKPFELEELIQVIQRELKDGFVDAT